VERDGHFFEMIALHQIFSEGLQVRGIEGENKVTKIEDVETHFFHSSINWRDPER